MICEKCEVAGYINEEVNERVWSCGITGTEPLRAMVHAWHAECKGHGCVCQHVVGDMINPLDVGTEERRKIHETLGTRFRKFLSNV